VRGLSDASFLSPAYWVVELPRCETVRSSEDLFWTKRFVESWPLDD
jgi:hypothetical protein